MRSAIVLLSGGLDSATVLVQAQRQGYACHALSFRYGQRHELELGAASLVAERYRVLSHRIVDLDLGAMGGSALTDSGIAVPEQPTEGIPVTYVPARNTLFLSYALAWAEVLNARDIFIGVNAVDYSGYPDCRPAFIDAFEKLANLATRVGVEATGTSSALKIHAPLLHLSKKEIIRLGDRLGVDYSMTLSCYQPDADGQACGICDSCRLRRRGFEEAGIPDPTRYQPPVE